MTRRPLALGFVVAIVVACTATLSMQPACDLPNKTCSGDKVSALVSDDGGASDPRSPACTRCMQDPACCDVLGACDEDQKCIDEFKRMQHCMIERGAGHEAECKQELGNSASKALYQCVRKPCGKLCGIPNCDLNPAVTLFSTPTCDRCIGSACCEQINACYGNRQCKLFLECVSNHCPHTIGTSMARVGALPREIIDTFEAAVCGDAGAAALTTQGQFDPGACLQRCLDEFAAPEAGLPDENKAASCLAVGVYTCGARNGCGNPCEAIEAVQFGPYPEDFPEAGADASDAGVH